MKTRSIRVVSSSTRQIGLLILSAAFACGAFCAPGIAQTPQATTQPAAKALAAAADPDHKEALGPIGSASRREHIATWFAELASEDSKTRDAAKFKLMGLERADLPALRKLVEQRRPLLPSQAVVLKEIVTQVYLSGDDFPTAINGHEGFLGIRPAEVSVGARPQDEPAPQQPPVQFAAPNAFPGGLETFDPSQVWGIMVLERMPGFAGARSLQDGDVILGIVELPKMQFRSAADFSPAIRALGAGKTVHLEVLRQGQILRVAVTLGPRPDDAESVPGVASPIQKLLDRRAKEASDLWESQFAPLLEEGLG